MKDLTNLAVPFKSKTYLDVKLQKVLISLQNNTAIVIKLADKGGNTVVLDIIQYTSMCLKILGTRSWDEPSSKELLNKAHLKLIKIFVSANQKEVIDQDMKEYLINNTPRTPIFYALTKVHKKVFPPPSRPIVSGIGGSTENVVIFVDGHMFRPCHHI